MPIRIFWLMEKNLNRVRAEAELRDLNVSFAGNNYDAIKEVRSKLTDELGTVVKIKGQYIVKSDPDAKTKFAAITGGTNRG